MGRAFESLQIVALLLIALLAWPWSVMLSAADSMEEVPAGRLGFIHAPESPGGQRALRHGPKRPPGRPVIAPDFDCDEDEDEVKVHDRSQLSLSSALALSRVIIDAPLVPVATTTSPVPPLRIGPREQLCRLRC